MDEFKKKGKNYTIEFLQDLVIPIELGDYDTKKNILVFDIIDFINFVKNKR